MTRRGPGIALYRALHVKGVQVMALDAHQRGGAVKVQPLVQAPKDFQPVFTRQVRTRLPLAKQHLIDCLAVVVGHVKIGTVKTQHGLGGRAHGPLCHKFRLVDFRDGAARGRLRLYVRERVQVEPKPRKLGPRRGEVLDSRWHAASAACAARDAVAIDACGQDAPVEAALVRQALSGNCAVGVGLGLARGVVVAQRA